jgi:hypothetical protein
VIVIVMEIRCMPVVVNPSVVDVNVTVIGHGGRIVLVVSVVMAMHVLVFDGVVVVRMRVALCKLEVHTNSKEHSRYERRPVRRSVAHRAGGRGSHERGEGEHRRGSSCPDMALSEQIEAQAQTVPGGSACEEPTHPGGRRKRVPQRKAHDPSEKRPKSPLQSNDLTRIEIGERPRNRAVQSPPKSCTDDRKRAPPEASVA